MFSQEARVPGVELDDRLARSLDYPVATSTFLYSEIYGKLSCFYYERRKAQPQVPKF
jgi:hypothetical protein